MKTFSINQTAINSELKYAVKAIRQANKGIGKVTFLPYEILYLDHPGHYALRLHYIDTNGKRDFYGIAI